MVIVREMEEKWTVSRDTVNILQCHTFLMSISGQLYTNPMQREQDVNLQPASFQVTCCDVPDACCDFVQPRGMSI